MVTERYLGAAWAAVHGPREVRSLATWTLDLGFRGLVVAPAPRPLDWRGLAAVSGDLPFDLPALRLVAIDAADGRADAGLASNHAGDRELAEVAVGHAVEQARRVGTDKVILEPGLVCLPGDLGPVDLGDPTIVWTADAAQAQLARRNVQLDRALDRACRTLHGLCRLHPDMKFCLTPSRMVTGLGCPSALAEIFADLPKDGLAYWHDAAIAARRSELLGEDQGLWLESFAPLALGMTLGDAADGQLNLPPGAGMVDYPLLGTYMGSAGSSLVAVVELDAGVDSGEIPGLHAFLTKFGL